MTEPPNIAGFVEIFAWMEVIVIGADIFQDKGEVKGEEKFRAHPGLNKTSQFYILNNISLIFLKTTCKFR